MESKMIPIYEFRFIPTPTAPNPMPGSNPAAELVCKELTTLSKAARLGPMIPMDCGIIIGELEGFAQIDVQQGVIPVPGVLVPGTGRDGGRR